MGVKVKIGENLHGDVVETHEAGGYVFLGEHGNLVVSSANSTNAADIVALYAPGHWISATVDQD